MAEVIFERIAPVVRVHDLDAALARYRRLGFATELDEPPQYGFVQRGAVQLHLIPDDPDDPDGTGGVVYVYVSDANALHASGPRQASKAGSWVRTTPRTAFGSSCTPTPTASCTKSARRFD